MSDLCQGRIVWIELADKRGFNKYPRPVIILTPTAEISSEDTLVCVVASHSASQKSPRPDSYVEVPHQPEGKVRTRLRKPTVAVCQWLEEFEKDDLLAGDVSGVVPPSCLKHILMKVREIHESPGN